MRPLKLIVSAFKSYGGKEEIDFTKLGNDGIYLIAGKTGAGKTTIFDAISYALFGSLSDGTSENMTLRSKYAKEDVATFVELTFSYKNKIYILKEIQLTRESQKEGKIKLQLKMQKWNYIFQMEKF